MSFPQKGFAFCFEEFFYYAMVIPVCTRFVSVFPVCPGSYYFRCSLSEFCLKVESYLNGLASAPPHPSINLLSHLLVAPMTRLNALAKSSGLETCRFRLVISTVISLFKIQFPSSSLTIE